MLHFLTKGKYLGFSGNPRDCLEAYLAGFEPARTQEAQCKGQVTL